MLHKGNVKLIDAYIYKHRDNSNLSCTLELRTHVLDTSYAVSTKCHIGEYDRKIQDLMAQIIKYITKNLSDNDIISSEYKYYRNGNPEMSLRIQENKVMDNFLLNMKV